MGRTYPQLSAMTTRKVRYKKLNVKTALPVLREGQIDPSEYESLTIENQIATGVEQAEENVSSNLAFVATWHVCISREITRELQMSHQLYLYN